MNQVRIVSFGYGHGPIGDKVAGASLVVDVRTWFRNPANDPAMIEMTGLHDVVRQHVLDTPGVPAFARGLALAVHALANTATASRVVLAIGCVGGRHRSVAIAQEVARLLETMGHLAPIVTHLDMHRPVLTRKA